MGSLLLSAMAKTVALIPLRGGSKSIPRKNIMEVAGKPLCFWVIDECLKSGIFDKVYISTEDSEIAVMVYTEYITDPRVIVIKRPKELATDTATTESVILHFTELIDYNILFTVQATSPLTRAKDFSNAMFQFALYDYDSMFSGVEIKNFLWIDDSIETRPLNYHPYARPMRQEREEDPYDLPEIAENGAFYVTKKETFMEHKCRLDGRIGCYLMSAEHIFELDEPEDLRIITKLLELRNYV